MKNEMRTLSDKPNAVRITVTVIGVLFGIAGINHGLFEILQGNEPTGGLIIQAIGEGQRFYAEGTEEAFTLIPNFLASGIAAVAIGIIIIFWSVFFIGEKHGRAVFLSLFILLFLTGGGIGQIAFFLPAWAFAKGMEGQLPYWEKVLSRKTRRILALLWPFLLAACVLFLLIGLEMAIFGLFPGLEDPSAISNTAFLFVLVSAVLNVFSFIAAYARRLSVVRSG